MSHHAHIASMLRMHETSKNSYNTERWPSVIPARLLGPQCVGCGPQICSTPVSQRTMQNYGSVLVRRGVRIDSYRPRSARGGLVRSQCLRCSRLLSGPSEWLSARPMRMRAAIVVTFLLCFSAAVQSHPQTWTPDNGNGTFTNPIF